MQLSAEIRWFWGKPTPILSEWFRDSQVHGCPAGGGSMRVDEYLHDPTQSELGIKRRGGKPGVEVKGLVAIASTPLVAGPFLGAIEVWSKWATEALILEEHKLIRTEKQRWLRKFDTTQDNPVELQLGPDEQPIRGNLPNRGCNVELTVIRLAQADECVTLGFEAFGTLDDIEHSLRAAAGLLVSRGPPTLGDGYLASYPKWLAIAHPAARNA